jgi:S-DNA-T family DNA segregation ATPase FtsK/SpoIIIE
VKEGLMKNKKKTSTVIVGLVILLASVLLLIAVLDKYDLIIYDYLTIQNAELSFSQIVRLDFPELYNPIGIFGALSAYWAHVVFGRFLSIAWLIILALIGFSMVFLKPERKFTFKIISFVVLALFLNMFILLIDPERIQAHGIVPIYVVVFFERIFSYTGALLISIALILTSLVVIFEISTIRAMFKFMFSLFKSGRKHPQKEKKKKPVKKTKEKKPKIKDNLTKKDTKKKPTVTQKQPVTHTNQKDVGASGSVDVYQIPSPEAFLDDSPESTADRKELQKQTLVTSELLESKLSEFDVKAKVINVNVGPIITQYELEPAAGVKVNKINSLSGDLALAIKAQSIRVAPVTERGVVSIEVPNKQRNIIYLKDILLSQEFRKSKSKLTFALGKDVSGNPTVTDLAAMPHLLIAGTTGSGKSVCINALICSYLFNTTPEEVRFVMIDPKRIELRRYEDIPHLIQKVVSSPEEAMTVLNWCVTEMERRYELLQSVHSRDLESYNKQLRDKKAKQDDSDEKPLPFIVVLIDELADLMLMSSGKDLERNLTRLAQKARAIGIHLVLATQKPTAQVLTGLIKVNFPTKVAFQVSNKIDSRVILDMNGAETLLGRGDMLFLPADKGYPIRMHGAYVSEHEVKKLIEYLKTQPKPEEEITFEPEEKKGGMNINNYDDELLPEAAAVIVRSETASVSMLQRHFKIGYARAGRLIDLLEQYGIVGKYSGSKPREVLVTQDELRDMGIDV